MFMLYLSTCKLGPSLVTCHSCSKVQIILRGHWIANSFFLLAVAALLNEQKMRMLDELKFGAGIGNCFYFGVTATVYIELYHHATVLISLKATKL